MALQMRTQPVIAAKRSPVAVPALKASRRPLRVVAAAGGYSGSNPYPSDPTPTPPGTPTTPPVYLRSTPTGGSGSGLGAGGAGIGGSGGRPVGTGGSGSGGDLPNLPSGWTLNKLLLTMLGIALAIPAWKYLNRRFFMKPEPEHTIAKVEDAAIDLKHDVKGEAKGARSAVSKAASAVKHATVDPIRDTVAHAANAVKHSDTGRAIQHKAEDAKDAVDIAVYDTSSKAERVPAKVEKKVKHAYEDTKEKGADTLNAGDRELHETKVKGGRALQRGKEAVSDAVYDAEVATGKVTKGVLENIKGAATSVGRKLHVVADSTEKGGRKAADKAERGLGVKHLGTLETTSEQRRKAAYVAGGVALGLGTLAALYYWDRKGGDISGKVRKLQDRTKEAANEAMGKARDALHRTTHEPAGPARPTA